MHVRKDGMDGTGGWIPFFEVASKDLDVDAPLLRSILDGIQQAVCCRDGYKLDSEAQFAMGWWFYTVYVREEFVRAAMRHINEKNPRDETAFLDLVKGRLRAKGSAASISLHKKRSLFGRHWVWLMR